MQIISGIQHEGAANQTATEILLFHLHKAAIASACQTKKLANGENDKGSIFSQKSHTDHPHTVSLFLCLFIPGLFCSPVRCFFAQNFTIEYLYIPQLSVALWTRWTGPVSSWTESSCHGEQREVRGNGILGQLVRAKLGTGGGGKFLWELHSLRTSGYIRRSRRRDKTGTDKGAVKTKKVDFAKSLR